ncbi:ciliogenesis-associated TTC17-interacting protein isoform X1 [Alosa sapidissima]|uniref:ciliogenesis-associated TTC17-interacting protein isoform X1 n=1 Tax=Alosa sapidissima TaxID=34773 RepID=UPI001C09DD76|nr:ciliogenesis-associated TTC17-interacting protein isoform X1 [Alosa sapidissima]
MENASQRLTEALSTDFLASIELEEVQRCLFVDSLVSVSDTGKELGEFCINIQKTVHNNQPCFLVHANSHGAIDNIPCGTSITGYVTTTFETLEQDHHEYVKLHGHSLERKSHMVRQDGQLVVNKVTREEEEVREQTYTFPLSSLRGFVSEASNLLILRILAQRKNIPEPMKFLSFDAETQICLSTYRDLGEKKQVVGRETVDVFGIERTVQTVDDIPAMWQCYFLRDGHLASRVQVGSPVMMKLLKMPALISEDEQDDKPVFEKRPLVWEEDMQLYSKFLDRKEELKADHMSYVRHHQELRALLADFLQFLLLRKPQDVFSFTREYFAPFSSAPTWRHFQSYSIPQIIWKVLCDNTTTTNNNNNLS